MMYGTGAALCALSLVWRTPPAVNRAGILAVAVVAAAVPFVVLALGRRFTISLSHAATLCGSALIGLLVYWGAGTYLSIVFGIFLVWVAQYSAMFYGRKAALGHIWFGLSLDALALATLPASPGNRLMIWLIIAGSCHVMVIAFSLVDRMSARYRGLVEHSGGVVAIVDTDLRIKYLAGALERLWGHKASVILGTSLLDW
ncbi:MAG: hypothetical protein JWO67_2375, partial [Streptosporangiaceae bacterium]|nr:hypothetical protein [Streptosporangiaceae bacterium]